MSESKIRDKAVLVTGAGGFIGSHVTRRMLRENARVSVLVRENTDLWRLADIVDRISIFKADIRDHIGVEQCIAYSRPDYVFHMAAYGVDSRQKDYRVAAETNILGTINLLNALKDSSCKKLLNIGSCMEYGNKVGVIREDAVLEPFNIYGGTKAAATILAHQLARENNLDLITLRAFGIFGENEGSHKFYPNIIISLLRGDTVKLTGCQQYRDYCYIDNLMDALVLAVLNLECRNEVFNVGSGCIHQLKYYVNLVYRHFPNALKPQFGAIPYRADEVWKPHPDVRKIKAMLGWIPKISLQEGLVRTISWYAQNLDKFRQGGR